MIQNSMLLKNQNMMNIKEVLLQWFTKKSDARANKFVATHKRTGINSENQQLAEELRKAVVRKFRKCKAHSSFRDNIWGAAQQICN